MLKETSAGRFQTITSSLARDVAVLWGRHVEPAYFYDAVDSLVRGYARYYGRHNIYISLTNTELSWLAHRPELPEISTAHREQNRFINIMGPLPAPFGHFVLEYNHDITGNVADMQNIQRVLLLAAIVFSIVAAIALHFILASIFRPLSIVATASKKIADGRFGERIPIKGKNELANVAIHFNKMVAHLEEEALSKQQFADNFAHEIRTPLTSIYGYAQYMQKARLSEEEIIESAGYILAEAGHMSNVANSLLELATLRNYAPAKSAIIISKLFADINQTLESPLRENGAELICHSGDDILIYGQQDLIRSLLLNLCTNGIKACAQGKGKIHLEAVAHSNFVTISVTDNGCGIPAESLAKIYEPFYRVDKSRSRELDAAGKSGAGLGLTLCKQIAEAHNAEISVQSSPGLGTIVKIKFTTS